jgi:threonine dehydrogenase-like Zn-dependent dehydrogenase
MRAAVLTDANRIEIWQIARPMVAPHEVLVRVEAVGLCGTDLHIFQGHSNYHRDSGGRLVPLSEAPQILGHEIAGVVAAVGSEVTDLRPGDRVILDQGRSCMGERRDPVCEYCRTGDSHQCEFYAEHGITGPQGGFAEFIAVPAANAVPLRSELDPAVAALVEPLGCIVHSTRMVLEANSRFRFDAERPEHRIQTVLIFGGGPAGLLFTQYLRKVVGFEGRLLVSEPNARRRALAERFGAEAIDPAAEDVAEAVRARTGGRKAELIIEATGLGAVFVRIPDVLRKQGTALLYGHGHTGVELGALNQVQFLEPTLISPAGASGGFEPDGRPSTFVEALRLVEQGQIDVASLITHRYPSLDAVPGALAGDHRLPEYVKGVVVL